MDTPFIDLELPTGQPMAETVQKIPPPRYLKTHYPYQVYQDILSDPSIKVIQVFKQPKDTLVSYFQYMQADQMVG